MDQRTKVMVAVGVVAVLCVASYGLAGHLLSDDGDGGNGDGHGNGGDGLPTLINETTFMLGEAGCASRLVNISNSRSVSYKFIEHYEGSQYAAMALVPNGTGPLKEGDVECWYYYKYSTCGLMGSDVTFCSAGFHVLEGEVTLSPGLYRIVICADSGGWGVTFNEDMGYPVTINVSRSLEMSSGLDFYDQTTIDGIGSTTSDYGYQKNVQSRGLFFRLFEVIDEEGFVNLQRDTYAYSVTDPMGMTFVEESSTYAHSSSSNSYMSTWGIFIFNIDVVNAGPGTWTFEGSYVVEGLNLEYDTYMSEVYLLY